MIERHLPCRQLKLAGEHRAEEIAAIVVRMAAFIGQRQQGIGPHFLDDLSQLLQGRSKVAKQFLIDKYIRSMVGKKFDCMHSKFCNPHCFFASRIGIGLTRAIALPEVGIARRAIGSKHNHSRTHAAQEGSTANNLVIGMGHQHQRAAHEMMYRLHVHL